MIWLLCTFIIQQELGKLMFIEGNCFYSLLAYLSFQAIANFSSQKNIVQLLSSLLLY